MPDEEQAGLFPGQVLEVMRLQAAALKAALKVKRHKDKAKKKKKQAKVPAREARRIRAVARSLVQEELFEHAPVKRKPADKPARPPVAKGHLSYPSKNELDGPLRQAVKTLSDPKEFDKLTVPRILAHLPVSRNTLWGLLRDYGYAQPGETLTKCLRRLAAEWHPEWRGVNRLRS